MSGPAAYFCPIHGRKLVPVGRSKAPATKPCPECRRDMRRDGHRSNRFDISITAATHTRLKAHADSVGMSIAEVIDALTQDIGGGE